MELSILHKARLSLTNVRSDWENIIYPELTKTYWLKLEDELELREQAGALIIPPPDRIFRCFETTSFHSTRVVLVGQDPYPDGKLADGLAFSVPFATADANIPRSLKNIHTELKRDLNIDKETKLNPHLGSWAAGGVLLLNSVLTTEQGKRGAHENFGWEKFTGFIIKELNASFAFPKVFIFLGAYAQQFVPLVTNTRQHRVITAPHPSPLSAHRGFFFSRIFSRTNELLTKELGRNSVNWSSICQPKY